MDKMNDPVALVIDFGTQSVRLGAVDLKGNIVAMEKEPYKPLYISNKPGEAEQDPDFYWHNFVHCAKRFSSKHSDLYKKAVGITLTAFRDTAVMLDKENKPIRPVIHWLDQRMAEAQMPTLPFWKRALFTLVRMSETIILNRRKSMSLWYQQNELENWKKTHHYVNISTYLNYLLTGSLKDGPSNYTGHYPLDYKSGVWYKNFNSLKNIFGIPTSMMPELVPPGGVIGRISKETSKLTGLPEGLELISGGSDKSCESLGVGALDPETASISYGTACTVDVSNKKYHEPEKFLPAYPACIPGIYNMEVQIYRGYWMLTWFGAEFATSESLEAQIQHLSVEELLNAKMLAIPPGSDGLVLQPYWGAGLKKPLARGAVIGFSDVHTRIHFYRAIIEGIAFALYEGLISIEKSQRKKVKQIRISGGGSQSDAICQISADIFGLPVSRVQTFETSTLGGGIVVFLAKGYFPDAVTAVREMVHPQKAFMPNPENHKKYEYLFKKVYSKLFNRLKDIYRDLTLFK